MTGLTKATTEVGVSDRLHQFFYLLQDDLEKFRREVEKSYELFKLGKKTN